MENEFEDSLTKFYEKLYNTLIKRKKKIVENSLLITFLYTKSNECFRLLNESSISGHKIQTKILHNLISEGLIRGTDTINNYTITANGIWLLETQKGVINEKIFLKHIDQKFFSFYHFAEKPLKDKQKVIVFSMISIRAFSEKSPVDLKKDEIAMNAWKEIIDRSYEKLKSLDLISKLNQKELYGKSPTEHPVSFLFRHTDELPKKTKGIYKAAGNQKYFLDISQSTDILKENLVFLFKQIFGDKILSSSQLREIYDFCCEIAHGKNIYVFDPVNHAFAKPEYDDIIKDVILFLQ